MGLVGLIPEPPFNPKSWSGSAAPFFSALRAHGILAGAREVALSPLGNRLQQARALAWPVEKWKEQYHASVPKFEALTIAAKHQIDQQRDARGVLQVGAWFSSGAVTSLPCFSYHDGNAAQWYRFYGRGLLSESRKRRHLDWERSVYQKLQGIFVMSSWLASSFVNDFGAPSQKVHVVGAGMNIDSLPELHLRDFSRPRFMMVGKDFERKGGRYLLEAFRTVRRECPKAELVLVGPQLNLDEKGVICAGFLSKSNPADVQKLESLFRSATTIVLPSIYEPFGISLTEGMAHGLPCIAADRCAMPEIVRHGESGLVVPAEDSAALARAMVEIATNPARAEQMGKAGRERAERDFTWSAVTGKIKQVVADQYGVN